MNNEVVNFMQLKLQFQATIKAFLERYSSFLTIIIRIGTYSHRIEFSFEGVNLDNSTIEYSGVRSRVRIHQSICQSSYYPTQN